MVLMLKEKIVIHKKDVYTPTTLVVVDTKPLALLHVCPGSCMSGEKRAKGVPLAVLAFVRSDGR